MLPTRPQSAHEHLSMVVKARGPVKADSEEGKVQTLYEHSSQRARGNPLPATRLGGAGVVGCTKKGVRGSSLLHYYT